MKETILNLVEVLTIVLFRGAMIYLGLQILINLYPTAFDWATRLAFWHVVVLRIALGCVYPKNGSNKN